MKNNFFKSLRLAIAMPVVLFTALAFITVSCEKEDFKVTDETQISGFTIMEVLKSYTSADEFSNLKRGRGAPAPGSDPIAGIAIEAGFDDLVGALVYVDEELDAGLVDLFLNGKDQFTVFAPTNEAFEALYGALEIDEISDLPAELVLDVLLYHVTEGRRAAVSVVPPVRLRKIKTLLGLSFSVSSGGVITDIAGSETGIVAADISASNGIIHVIDGVLLPLNGESKKRGRGAPAPGTESIAAIAIDAGFSELVSALAYVDEELDAGLVDLFLNGKDQFTVFAPTNEAFEALYGALEIDEISDLPVELVLDVLLYHVTEGRRAAVSVVPPVRPRNIKTLLGESFSVSSGGVITDIAGNSINIAAADISASNGIIHVIDGVLLPLE